MITYETILIGYAGKKLKCILVTQLTVNTLLHFHIFF